MPRRPAPAAVFSLVEARLARRVRNYRQRLTQVIAANKRSIGRLYVSGLLFSKDGSRAGRDLLLAHQHLLRVMTLLERLGPEGAIPRPKKQSEIESIFAELDLLLVRTTTLTERTHQIFEHLKQ